MDILSTGKSALKIRPYLRKVFENIFDILLDKDDITVLALVS